MNLYEAALQIATEAHKGQTRDNGEPYITHPIAVAGLIEEKADTTPVNVVKAIALLHDVGENCGINEVQLYGFLCHYSTGITARKYINRVVNAVSVLTRKKDQSYAQYIAFIANATWCAAATAVKLADLQHNLSDHKPGARRDKYELAVALLKA